MKARAIVGFVKEKLVILAAVVVAAMVGGATTAIVLAAVPDSDGVIHGCHSSGNDFRLIDTENSQTCTGGETQVSWNSHDLLAYGLVSSGTIINTSDARNVENVYASDGIYSGQADCFAVAGTPSTATLTGFNGNPVGSLSILVRDSGNTHSVNDHIDGYCGNDPSADVVVKTVPGQETYYITFFE